MALPLSGLLAPLEKLAAADLGKVKITDIKMRPSASHTQIRIDTDAGISGMGESGVTAPMMKAWMDIYKPLLVGQDPLAIGYHWHRMSTLMHTYMARIPALSGIDMALWDLSGRLLNVPVYKLLGGPFREQVPVFINTEPRNMLDPASVKDWADQFRASPLGFRACKINTHTIFGIPMGRYTTALSAQDLHKLRTSFGNVRKELGLDYDIMVHCHWEFDLRTSIQLAQAVEPIKPVWLEDPLGVDYSDSWKRLAASSPVPICTGENLARREGFKDFILNQGCDILHPDLRNSGGFLETKRIADMAAVFGLPMANHNTGSQVFTYSTCQWAASIRDYIACETITGQGGWMDQVLVLDGPYIKDGFVQVADKPGLGIELNRNVVEAHLATGERWWS